VNGFSLFSYINSSTERGEQMCKGEKFNCVSHLVGAVAAAVGLVVLVVLAERQGDPWKMVSFGIYGTSLCLMFTTSTLYHGLEGKARRIFRKFDHYAIYLLIAGTYTPFTLVTLRGALGWSLFSVIWGLAVLGIMLDSLPHERRRILPVGIYLLMGWLALIALDPLLQTLPYTGFLWLLIGGLFYTVGVIFYALDEKLHYAHNVWHLFVLAGSGSHYLAILFYVV
jgi:hemolysin III